MMGVRRLVENGRMFRRIRKRLCSLRAAPKALLVQCVAWALALALLRAGALPSVGAMLAVQAGVAVLLAWGLRSAWWWWAIHAVFAPLAWWVSRAGLAPGWYLAAFVLLVLFYRGAVRTQVPLYLSSRAAMRALAARLPVRSLLVLDLGCGTGTVLRTLARMRPQDTIVGVENSLALVWLCRWRTRRRRNVEVRAGDFLAQDWRYFDVVYAFLSPAPMAAVWEKARRELRPGAWLVSNSFPVPEVEAQISQPVGREGMLQQVLYWYQPNGAKERQKAE